MGDLSLDLAPWDQLDDQHGGQHEPTAEEHPQGRRLATQQHREERGEHRLHGHDDRRARRWEMGLRPRLAEQRGGSGEQRHVADREPVGGRLREHDPARSRGARADHRDHDALDDRHAERVLGVRPRAQADDVQRVDHRGDQGQRLAVPQAEAGADVAEGEYAESGDREQHGHPGQPTDAGTQQHRGEQRRGHDVHPGDEPRDAGSRRGEPGGLHDLGDPVEGAEDDGVPHAVARQADRLRGDQQDRDRGDREPHGQEVEHGHPVEQVVDQEERRPPARGDREQGEGGEEGDPGAWGPGAWGRRAHGGSLDNRSGRLRGRSDGAAGAAEHALVGAHAGHVALGPLEVAVPATAPKPW